jgi:hypothetical protein
MSKQTVDTVFGSLDEKQQRTLIDGVKEISVHLSRIEGEREAIKDIIDSVKDDINVPKKIINRFAKTYHKQNFAEQNVEDKEFAKLYVSLVSGFTNE